MRKIKVNKSEYLLGQMIAETRRRGLKSCRGNYFYPNENSPVACCAVGALRLLKKTDKVTSCVSVINGNDYKHFWDVESRFNRDTDESLGWAFYQACQD